MPYTDRISQSIFTFGSSEIQSTKMRVIWWNSGISGLLRKKERCVKQKKSKDVLKIDHKLMQSKMVISQLIEKADILVLGEFGWMVNPESIVQDYNMRHSDAEIEYGVVNLCVEASGSRVVFDNYLIYNCKVLTVDRVTRCFNVGTCRQPQYYKAYQIVAFKHLKTSDFNFELAVVHWNMRDGYGRDYLDHMKFMAAEKLSKRLEKDGGYPYKMVVGDFNNEPYEEAFRWMGASRSKGYVNKNKGLYNPFWRFLDGENFTIASSNNHCFKDNGAVFDSVLVNDCFLKGQNAWSLTPSILTKVFRGLIVDKHDHYPIMLELAK